MNTFLGIDIGGTKCAVVYGDENGNVLEKERMDTADFETTFPNLMKLVEKMYVKHPDVSAIGISCGGPLDSKKGVIMSPPNLPGWDDVHIVQYLKEQFGLPTFIKNDADACAIAEWKWGAAKGYDHAIFLTCSTGMGAGLILNGRPYCGACDMAGEVGHIRLRKRGHIGYNKKGSFEGCCSGGGMAQYGKSAKEFADLAHRGNPRAKRIYKKFGRDLGLGISYLVDILNPQVIVIGSIFERSRDLIEPFMLETLQKEALSHSLKAIKIVPSQLGDAIGDMASLSVAMDGYSQQN